MNWKALLKIIAAVGAGGVVVETQKVATASGWEIAGQILTIAGIVGAYLLRQPVEKKAPEAK